MNEYRNPPPLSGKAVAALVLGIFSLIIPLLGAFIGVVALSFAGVALREIRYRGVQGQGLAIAGLVCGIVALVIYGVLGAMLYFIGTYSDPVYVDPDPFVVYDA